MKKIFLPVLLILLTLFFIPKIINAHPGNVDSYSCHTCYTNCPAWGHSYGEYHCHNYYHGISCDYSVYDYEGLCVMPYPGCSKDTLSRLENELQDIKEQFCQKDEYGNVGDCSESPSRQSLVNSTIEDINSCKTKIGKYNTELQGYNFCIEEEKSKRLKDKEECWNKKYELMYQQFEIDCIRVLGNGAYYEPSANFCACKNGYRLNETSYYCEKIDFCASQYSNSYTGYDEKCYCKISYQWNESKTGCELEKVCPQNSKMVDDTCLCSKGFKMSVDNGQCIETIEKADNNSDPIKEEKKEDIESAKISEPVEVGKLNNQDLLSDENTVEYGQEKVQEKKTEVINTDFVDEEPYLSQQATSSDTNMPNIYLISKNDDEYKRNSDFVSPIKKIYFTIKERVLNVFRQIKFW